MSSESPNAILYDYLGNELAVQNGVATPANTPLLMVGGSDGTNSRYLSVDTSGRQILVGAGTAGTPTGGVISIQGVSGGQAVPISGSVSVTGSVTTTNSSVSATGSAVPSSATYIGADVVSSPPSLTAGNLAGLTVTTAGRLIIDGSQITQPVSGTVTANAGTGNFSVVQATAANLNATVTANGNFNNASVSATGASPPSSATYIGGSVTTSSPTYTTGQMNPLSLTTAGALRVDGSAVTQPVSGTVTANAGTGTFTVSGTVTSNQGTSPWVTNITQFGSSNIVTGTGVSGAGIPRVTVSSDSSVGAVQSGTWIVTATQTTATNLNTLASQGSANTLANAWPEKITDGTNGPAAVKAASTAAVAADPALVVAVSPNNTVATQVADVTATGALGALNAAVQISLAGEQGVGFQLAAGTLIGTIVAELSWDGGTTWNSTYIDTGNKVSSIIFSSSNTATQATIIGGHGAGLARIRVSAYTSGTANITLRASQFSDPVVEYTGFVGAGILPPVTAQVGGSDGSNLRTWMTDTLGAGITGDIPYAANVRISGGLVGRAFGFNSSSTAGLLSTTAYTEQTSAAVRSLKSTSASDTLAGTGAQKVTIVGYDASMNRLTEVVNMNGTTAVATSNSYQFIESLTVTQAGSGGANAGVITLYVNNAGGGGTITTIGTGSVGTGGDNSTFLGLHYVRAGKTCYVYDVQWDNGGVESSIVVTLRIVNPIATGPAETTVAIGPLGRYTGYTHPHRSPLVVTGPARIRLYRVSTSGNIVNASFDWVEF